MALRDENCLFTRRIADRGSDKTVFDSQDHMIQETDPKDVIWDEIVGKEEYPEEGDGYKFQETDSESFIRDENYGKEEYPGSCSTLYL
ncbi:mitogen-activated protein (MAP) kinase kinase kinase Ste11, Cryptococcus [Artemisia annua]|uniref:Mitogen-activated protein (MAP) kinase kinase kinase Ste11, Cryptococcus n=1 Tax=Artemisia annua TaxID=35608 RepID=A0A2U1PW90_ARTAN|nr:mitogen-activated protein (MAP) kinase kinase kinase Ste11, Cryptococcus [Artemisia annua]